ncbi:MAG: hypothetical protein NTNFB02_29570 [Nitrospira sp.]
MIKNSDMLYLRRCVELVAEALEAGEDPFGSVLAAADGTRSFPPGPSAFAHDSAGFERSRN